MTLAEIRQFYSEEIRLAAPLRSQAVIDAFARVPREEFLGAGPWRIASGEIAPGAAYFLTEDAQPRHVYHNIAIALDPGRNLNNGQPSTLARWIEELAIQPGARVFHLGCGVGYYTAILAEVTGPEGHVFACEVDGALAARARANLSRYANVTVAAGDGAVLDPADCDAMLINAGVTLPLPAWLDRLRQGGTMIVPLTVSMMPALGKGMAVKITRDGNAFPARAIGLVMIYSCEGGRDPETEPALGKAMAAYSLTRLTCVLRDPHEARETCLVHGAHLCLSSGSVQ